jgi:hypothetical protein
MPPGGQDTKLWRLIENLPIPVPIRKSAALRQCGHSLDRKIVYCDQQGRGFACPPRSQDSPHTVRVLPPSGQDEAPIWSGKCPHTVRITAYFAILSMGLIALNLESLES